MPIAALISLVLRYGPSVISYIVKFGPEAATIVHELHGMMASGKTTVSPDDLARLNTLAGTTADDYLKEAGVTK